MSSVPSAKRLKERLARRAVKKRRIKAEDSPGDDGRQTAQAYLSSRFCDSVMEIINDLLMTPSEVILKAARLGCVGWLEKLLSRPGYEATTDAAIAAASNGHVDVLKVIYASWNSSRSYVSINLRYTTEQALAAAAESGCGEVVKFLATQVGRYDRCGGSALSKAIARGDIRVVKLLLNPRRFTWDFVEAVTEAIAGKQSAIVKLIHRRFPYSASPWNDTLIVCMAGNGQLGIVKYLYKRNLWDSESIGKAFKAAASRGYKKILEFLHGTGVISPQASDRGFVAAAQTNKLGTTMILYSKQTVSVEAMNQAFRDTGSSKVVAYLYDTGLISMDSLANVLQGESSGMKGSWGQDRKEIIKLLLDQDTVPTELIFQAAANNGDATLVEAFYDATCYPTDAIIDAFKTAITYNFEDVVEILGRAECLTEDILSEAFVESAERGQAKVVSFLLSQDRVSSDVITEAFVAATKGWQTTVVQMLFQQQQASAKEIGHLFKRAVRTGHFPIARELIRSPHIAQEMKDDALLTVARSGKSGSKKFISTSDCWSREVLAQALEFATEVRGVKRVLTKMADRN